MQISNSSYDQPVNGSNRLQAIKDYTGGKKINRDPFNAQTSQPGDKAISNHNQVISTYAHDLKAPLTLISLAAELLQDEHIDAESVLELSQQILKASSRTNDIINELLESMRVDADHIGLNFSTLDFGMLLSKVVDANQLLAAKKAQSLTLIIESNAFVHADHEKLSEITSNLINNAIKFSPAHKKITVTLKQKKLLVILEVQDEGQGLTAEDKRNLFKRFTRLSASPTAGENSTGLGLSIVKTYVEAQNGMVWAESAGRNKGSKFVVALPACR